jgi:predicted enzyme related to lactoylglutathione lyase
VHLDFVVEDIEAGMARAVNAGATLEQSVQNNNRGKQALMADPFGNGFFLVQFTGRGYDEIAT